MHSFFSKLIKVVILIPVSLIASFDKAEPGAAVHSLGMTGVAIKNSPFSIFYNPANLNINQKSTMFSFRNYYNISGLNQYNIVINYPFFNQPLALGIHKYGNNLYSETTFAFATSFNYGSVFQFGICLNYFDLTIRNFGQAAAYGINAGITYAIHDSFWISAALTNLNQPVIGTIREKLSQTFTFGFGYSLNENIILYGEIYRDMKFENDYRAGIEYKVFDYWLFRTGISDNSDTYTIGTGFLINKLIFDYALLVHQVLGASHSVTFGWQL